jgi:hypothetical protein
MVWFFERGDDEVRVEARYDRIAAEYLVVQDPGDGTQHVERFADAASFRAGLLNLEQQFPTGEWTRRGPVFLRDGWTH